MRTYRPMFDLETFCIIRDLVRDSAGGDAYLEIRPYFQRFALNTTLTLCYGIRMDSVWDDMLREVLEVGSAISLLRSASENYQDYIPCQIPRMSAVTCRSHQLIGSSTAIPPKQREESAKQVAPPAERQILERAAG